MQNNTTSTAPSVPVVPLDNERESKGTSQHSNISINNDFFDHLANKWFLQINRTLNDIFANTALSDKENSEPIDKTNKQASPSLLSSTVHSPALAEKKVNLAVLHEQFTAFFIAINSQYVLPKAQQLPASQADEFNQLYADLLEGISYLYMGCLAPELAQGRFDYGAEQDKRRQQQIDVTGLSEFFSQFYLYLLTKHPSLPILYSKK